MTDRIWAQSGEDDLTDDARMWSTVIVVSGTLSAMAGAFARLSQECSETPSGDDDVFDYWPSGMRLLHAMADDLYALTGDKFYLQRYNEVHDATSNVPEADLNVPDKYDA